MKPMFVSILLIYNFICSPTPLVRGRSSISLLCLQPVPQQCFSSTATHASLMTWEILGMGKYRLQKIP